MNKTNKALIALLAVQGLLAVVMLGRLERSRLAEAESLVPSFSPDAVERIEIVRGTQRGGDDQPDTEAQLVLAKENGIWLAKSHYDFPADPDLVDEFLDKVRSLESRGPIAEGPDRQQQLFVAPDHYQRKVLLYTALRPEPIIIYIGGGAGGRKSAVRVGESDAIHAVSGFGASSAQYAVSPWLETRYFEVEPSEVVSLTIENAAGRFEFVRTPAGAWTLSDNTPVPPAFQTSPEGKPMELDQRAVENAVRALSLIKFNQPADPNVPRGSPLATVTMEVIPGASGPVDPDRSREVESHIITVGPEWDGMYIINRDRAPAVMIHFNQLSAAVNMSFNTLMTPKIDKPQGSPGFGPPGAAGTPPPHGSAPAGAPNPHGGAPAGAPNPHGGAAPQGQQQPPVRFGPGASPH